MPRKGRIVLPHYPHHIVQRGHNRQVVFVDSMDYRYYLATLEEFKAEYGLKVYAFCLMTNHVHLLIQPSEQKSGLAALMKRLAGRQTRYRNKMEGRSGTLWESRFKSSPVQTDQYVLACKRYIEMNPVRARMVSNPADYPWSSYSSSVGENTFSWLDFDPCYLALGATFEERRIRYRDYVNASVAEDEWALIRDSVRRNHLTGTVRFADEVESIIGIRVESRKPGRPRKLEK